MTHKVTSGETLSQIAEDNDLTLAELLDANPQFRANPGKIKVGDVVNIPDGQPPPLPPPDLPPPPGDDDSRLGVLSAKFETGNRGPGTVSSGRGDPGGVSYGSYQMSSKKGVVGRFVNQADFPFKDEFAGLEPGGSAFTAKWKAIADAQPEVFQSIQHTFIKKTHYDPLVATINSNDNFDVDRRSFALRNVVWSTAVQHGSATPIVDIAFNKLDVTPEDAEFDAQLISAVYAERGRKNAAGVLVHFPSSKPDVQRGVANRFKQEEKDALKLLRG